MNLLKVERFPLKQCRDHWSIARALMRAIQASLRLFDLRYGVLAVHLFGVELDFIARFDGLEQRGILRLVDHGHAALHSEPLGRAMLDGDLAGGLIDFHDLPVDQPRLGDSALRRSEQRERQDDRWSCSHVFSLSRLLRDVIWRCLLSVASVM